jgi:excisionase family DNA binding protein
MNATQHSPRALTIHEAANELRLSPATVRRRIQDGTIRASKIGGATRIAAAEIDRLLSPEGCVVCRHPYRELIEVELYDGRPNEGVARRYAIGDAGGEGGGEVIRLHRSHGHMRPRDAYRDERLVNLRERAEAAAATEDGKAALRDARTVFDP